MWEDKSFGNYVAGQADADSYFGLEVSRWSRNVFGVRILPNWAVSKAYDFEILEEIKNFLGVGRLKEIKASKSYTHHYRLSVTGTKCSKIVEFFEKFPLRANKQKDFEIWKKAVKIYNNRSRFHGPGSGWKKEGILAMLQLRKELDDLKSRRKHLHKRDINELIRKIESIQDSTLSTRRNE